MMCARSVSSGARRRARFDLVRSARSRSRCFNTGRAGGVEVVGMPGLQARPLGKGTSFGTHRVLAFWLLRPAGRRILPPLLPPVDGQVEQPIAIVHRLHAAYRRPVSLEDFGSLSQVANDIHPIHLASNQESVERDLGRVPRHFPPHEGALPAAPLVGPLENTAKGGVASKNIGKPAPRRGTPGAPPALL